MLEYGWWWYISLKYEPCNQMSHRSYLKSQATDDDDDDDDDDYIVDATDDDVIVDIVCDDDGNGYDSQ